MNWLGSYYFEVTVAGREENEVEDQQTADAILSINYRDKVGQKLLFCPDFYFLLQRHSWTKAFVLSRFLFVASEISLDKSCFWSRFSFVASGRQHKDSSWSDPTAED